jgi:hypothetical protein
MPSTAPGVTLTSAVAPAMAGRTPAAPPSRARQALRWLISGATNAIREIGGVLGVAVLAAVFGNQGDYETPRAFMAGFTPALTIGAITVALGAAAALLIPRKRSTAVSLNPAVQPA